MESGSHHEEHGFHSQAVLLLLCTSLFTVGGAAILARLHPTQP